MKNELLAGLIGLASLSAAQFARFCDDTTTDVCYGVSVPESSASSGSGDIYFQIRGPTSLQWMAMGQGQQMRGSNIFVVYQALSGDNVTLSPRLGQGHFMPQYNPDADVELLEGSGVSDGFMTANVRCGNCQSWSGGQMDFSSSSTNWIYSYREGEALQSDSEDVNIMQHSIYNEFTLDLTQAQTSGDTNPFAASSTNPNSGASEPTGNVGASGGPATADPVGASGGARSSFVTLLTAHGTIMGLCFVLFFPSGVLIRALMPSTTIWVHAGIQSLAYLLAIAGMGIGIDIALELGLISSNHAIIGLVTICLMAFQPIGGLLQHAHFRKHGTRSIAGWGHRFMGIALIILGIVNGGLGLQLADNTRSGTIAYGVLAGVFGIAMIGAFLFTTFRSNEPIVFDKHAAGKENEHEGSDGANVGTLGDGN